MYFEITIKIFIFLHDCSVILILYCLFQYVSGTNLDKILFNARESGFLAHVFLQNCKLRLGLKRNKFICYYYHANKKS